MKRITALLVAATLLLCAGCGKPEPPPKETTTVTTTATETTALPETTTETTAETTTEASTLPSVAVSTVRLRPDESIRSLSSGFSYASYVGDYYFDDYLAEGGAASDSALSDFLVKSVITGNVTKFFKYMGGGCSTISVAGKGGTHYFGRNFDWNYCNAMILLTVPKNGYRSVSTVNTDFITKNNPYDLTDDLLRLVAVYTPLDGMNEKGLCVSVNMVYDDATINQNTGKPDLTTTTALRLVLDRAATVDEAVKLLKSYDMHASLGHLVHFAICDASGKSVAVEYINNSMVVTETPVLTNYYVAPGDKHGVGSALSRKRADTLRSYLTEGTEMDAPQVRAALKSVATQGSSEFKSTEWTVIFDQKNLTAEYYHRENFGKSYTVSLF